ncbi:hypothetical protein Q7P37_007028 [Cladosporium fusiforme]
MPRHALQSQDFAPVPDADEVVILNFAVALKDPQLWKNEKSEMRGQFAIPGQGMAGTVVDVGANVTRFRPGQRVMALCYTIKTRVYPAGGYQQFTISSQSLVSAIPDSLSFELASTFPLSVTLAAAGLYQTNHLGAPLPRSSPNSPSGTILVMDGASDVGAMVVQLATASGLRVIATASRRNFDIVKSFGASVVVDHDQLLEGQLAEALGESPLAGVFDTISTTQSFTQIDALLHETMQYSAVCALMPPAQSPVHFSPSVVVSTTINRNPHTFVRTAIWEEFVPGALKSRRLRPKPTHTVIRARREDVVRALSAVDAIPRKAANGMIIMSFT